MTDFPAYTKCSILQTRNITYSAHTTTDPTPNRPLWQAMQYAYAKWVKERTANQADDRYGYAAELRAIADWLVPEEPMIVEGGRSYEQAWLVSERERLRRLLLDEADKAEARDE
jgi:hypothetical protein